MVEYTLAAAEILAVEGVHITVVNCRFLKPYDATVLSGVLEMHQTLLVVEEGTVVNGFGAHIATVVHDTHPGSRVATHGVPDEFVEQAPRARQLAVLGLDAVGIAARVRSLLAAGALTS
jgi:1-deoxy-D-xylulose-5-phosphate synthase